MNKFQNNIKYLHLYDDTCTISIKNKLSNYKSQDQIQYYLAILTGICLWPILRIL